MTTAASAPSLSPLIEDDFEEVVVSEGPRSGASITIAVHSTRLGPALGGARLWRYPSPAAAMLDAMRLAEAMTSKAAVAGLGLGGGKAVICSPRARPLRADERRRVLLDFGDAVERLGGRYVTAEDVGTGADDMAIVSERTRHVVGLPQGAGGSGDPSPLTALGVLGAIEACLEHRFGTASVEGRRVCVVGIGHVGTELCSLLRADGAELTISDIDPGKRSLCGTLDARWIDPVEAVGCECDVLAPCALGGVIDARAVPELRCEIVCGGANNVLADERLAAQIEAANVLYAPDFVVNAGGLISVYAEFRSLGSRQMLELVARIKETTRTVLAVSAASGEPPLTAARLLAADRLRAPAAAI